MPTSATGDGARWVPHPVRAAALRVAAVVIPVLVAVAVGALVGALLPPAHTLRGVLLQWTAVLGASTLAAVLVERLTRRLLPIATLLKLSMLFPDRAPSRYKLARRVAGTGALASELERARKAGVHGDRQQAAETILALVGMLGDYDSRTRGHSERTQLFVSMLADEMKLRAEDRDKLVWAALVHDIGKLRVPTEVLNKPGKPDEDEWERLRSHPAAGATICSPLQEWLGPWWPAIEQHHERFDGLGYPAGLAGAEISLGARIVSVADSYEVMTAARPYKKAMSATAAREELARCAGSQFDPVVVRAFLSISLGRLRWAAGPLAWVAQVPVLQPVANLGPYVGPLVGKVAGVAAGAATAGAALLGLGLGPGPAVASEPVAAPEQRQEAPDERPTAPETARPTVAATPTTAPAASPTALPTATPSSTAPAPVRPVPAPTTAAPTGGTPAPQPRPQPQPQPEPQPEPQPRPNRAPVAADDGAGTAEDTAVAVDLLANDGDADSDGLVALVAAGPQHGTASVAGGVLRYTPAADWSGTDVLTYEARDPDGATATATVTLTVTAVNDAPVAGGAAATTAEDTAVDVDLLASAGDVDGDALDVAVTAGPQHGTASVTGGVLRYTPAADRSGADAVTYEVRDPDGASATATATISVTPVDDAPVAGDDAVTTDEDATVQLDLLANDTDADGDPLTATLASAPAHGTATLTAAGLLTYEPDADRHGTDVLTYTVTDPSGRSAAATVTVDVRPVADAPRAVDDAFTVVAGQPLTGSVLDNDGDEDGDPLTVVGDDSPDLDVAVDGSFTWTPGSPGVRVFTYTVSDGTLTSTGTVSVTVTAAPATGRLLYLHGSPTGVPGLLSPTAPGLPGDWDLDLKPGVTLEKGDLKEDEGDKHPERVREWRYTVPAGGLQLDGPIALELRSRTDELDLGGGHVDYTVRLDACRADGTGCVRVALADDVHVEDWSPGLGYETRTLVVGSSHQTVPAGWVLRLRLQVDHADLWIPLDGVDPSVLRLTTVG